MLVFGVDYRLVDAPYIGPSLHLGIVELPLRLLVPCVVALVMVGGLQLFMSRTFLGRAILAVAQDQLALRLMAANPTRIKRIAFGLSIATASIAGAVLIVIQPVEPSIGRDYIGRVFAICVLGGMGSFAGTVVAAMTLGIVESLTATFYGPSWSPAVAFRFLLVTLAVRPAGIFGRWRVNGTEVLSAAADRRRDRVRRRAPDRQSLRVLRRLCRCCNISRWRRPGISWAAIPAT